MVKGPDLVAHKHGITSLKSEPPLIYHVTRVKNVGFILLYSLNSKFRATFLYG